MNVDAFRNPRRKHLTPYFAGMKMADILTNEWGADWSEGGNYLNAGLRQSTVRITARFLIPEPKRTREPKVKGAQGGAGDPVPNATFDALGYPVTF